MKYVVVNPASDRGETGRRFSAMLPIVERALGKVSVRMTERPGDGARLAAAMAHAELVVAVGGDGTLSEVVHGVMQLPPDARPAIGLIGQGTGGDFRRTLGMDHRLDRYLEALTSEERRLDVGEATFEADGSVRYFINVLSVGLGGRVDELVRQGGPRLGGRATYFMASARALLSHEATPVRLTLQGEHESVEQVVAAHSIAICNGQYFGGGMWVAPMARVDDGRLEVLLLGTHGARAQSKWGFVLQGANIYSGKHLASSVTRHFAVHTIRITPALSGAKVAPLDVDGDPVGSLPVTVTVQRGALRFRGKAP